MENSKTMKGKLKVSVIIKIKFDLNNDKSFKLIQKALNVLKKNAKVTDLESIQGTNVYKEVEDLSNGKSRMENDLND